MWARCPPCGKRWRFCWADSLTIWNALRFALGIFSGKIIFNDCKTARPRLRSNESPSGAFKRQNVLAGARWRGLAPTSSAGLAVLLFHENRLFPVQSVVACLKSLPFCKKHCRRICSLLRAKREPERTAVPAGHESPSGAFKPQTGLQSKCRVFSAARSPLLSRRGRHELGAARP